MLKSPVQLATPSNNGNSWAMLPGLASGSTAQIIIDPNTIGGSDGDLVSSVNDSVSNIPFTASGAARPVLKFAGGRKYLQFNGAQNLATAAAACNLPATGFSMVFVADFDDFLGGTGNFQNVILGFQGSGARSVYLDRTALRLFDGTTKGGYGGILNQKFGPNIFTIWGNASNVFIMCNGVRLFDNPALALGNITQLRLGQTDALTAAMKGKIHYFEAYNTAFADQAAALVNEKRIRKNLGLKKFATSGTKYFFQGNSLFERFGASDISKGPVERGLALSAVPVAKQNYLVRGFAGGMVSQMVAPSQKPSWLDDYMPVNGDNTVLVLWELTNTLNAGVGGSTTYTSMIAYLAALKAQYPNIKTCVVTCIPRNFVSMPLYEVERMTVNTAIMMGCTAVSGKTGLFTKGTDSTDFVLNVGAIANLADFNNLTYFLSDKTHLTDAGYEAVAQYIAGLIDHTYIDG